MLSLSDGLNNRNWNQRPVTIALPPRNPVSTAPKLNWMYALTHDGQTTGPLELSLRTLLKAMEADPPQPSTNLSPSGDVEVPVTLRWEDSGRGTPSQAVLFFIKIIQVSSDGTIVQDGAWLLGGGLYSTSDTEFTLPLLQVGARY
jgi:hypothetical protein